jgi:hypothetical protein
MREKNLLRRRESIPSVQTFLNAIHIERARTDRTGESFSLVLFETGRGRDDRSTRRLRSAIERRRRASDLIGWFDSRHLGVLLPATPLEGAREFAVDIVETLQSSGMRTRHSVFSYPAQKLEIQHLWEEARSLG